jgi:hypothetical protein
MRPKLPLLLSVLLNLILAGWLMLLLGARRQQPIGAPPTTVSPESVASRAQQRGAARAALRLTEAPRVVPFDWRQVEAPDYKQYIDNLRAIGCPEKTIRDIVVADVNDLFSSRLASVTNTNQYQYWRKEPVSRSEEQERQVRELCAQKREVLKTLGMGTPDFTDLLGEAFRGNLEELDLQLAFLPEFKRQQIKDALFQQAQQEVTGGQDAARQAAIEQQAQARVESLLTSEELKEYELRCSTDAHQLRTVLDAVGLTEQEFRIMFDSWRSLKAFSPGTAEYRAAQQSSEATIQQLLGADRFQSYLSAVKVWGYSK